MMPLVAKFKPNRELSPKRPESGPNTLQGEPRPPHSPAALYPTGTGRNSATVLWDGVIGDFDDFRAGQAVFAEGL
jgi:hypothetical protein